MVSLRALTLAEDKSHWRTQCSVTTIGAIKCVKTDLFVH